jgi:hypothetical protein
MLSRWSTRLLREPTCSTDVTVGLPESWEKCKDSFYCTVKEQPIPHKARFNILIYICRLSYSEEERDPPLTDSLRRSLTVSTLIVEKILAFRRDAIPNTLKAVKRQCKNLRHVVK